MNIETYLWYLYKPYKTEFILAFPVWQRQESKRSYWVGPEELANKACSRIFSSPKPLSIWQRKHTHMHMNTPPNPRNLHFLNIVGNCPISKLTLCSILCLPTKVKRARHKHAVTASGPHCQAVLLTVSSLPPLWASTKCENPSDWFIKKLSSY